MKKMTKKDLVETNGGWDWQSSGGVIYTGWPAGPIDNISN